MNQTDPTAVLRDEKILSRFWEKVDKTDGCWTWTGTIDSHGYGQIWINKRRYAAHRLSYLLAHGEIPSGLVIDHVCHGLDENCTAEGGLCRHRSCVNPDHLEAVTHQVNLLRGHGASGKAARRTHCPQGHPYDEANTLMEGKTRRCRACRKAREAATRTVLPPAERTHCPQGHPYSEENTYIRPNGSRCCRACGREKSRYKRKDGSVRRRVSAEARRLAMSEALGLGTGAPWEAILERAAELSGAQQQPQTEVAAARAAVLLEAAEVAESFDIDASPQAVAAELRRLAVEAHGTGTQQPEGAECNHPKDAHRDGDDPVTPGTCRLCPPDDAHHDYEAAAGAQQQPDTEAQPFRADQFEQWLKARRDEHGWQGSNDRRLYDALDVVLDRYRLHADTGTPLGEHVCERASSLEECDCLEPAPVAQQPAAAVPTLAQMAVADHEYRELLMRRHQEMTAEQQAAAADGEETQS